MVVIISASITERDKAFVDKLVLEGKHQTRSDAIRHAIRLLREYDEGKFYGSPTSTYNYKPIISRVTIKGHGYFLPDAPQGNIQAALMSELKAKQIEMGIREVEPIQEIDCGFDELQFDPAKCKEALMVNGKVQQCDEFRVDGEDYCYRHLK